MEKCQYSIGLIVYTSQTIMKCDGNTSIPGSRGDPWPCIVYHSIALQHLQRQKECSRFKTTLLRQRNLLLVSVVFVFVWYTYIEDSIVRWRVFSKWFLFPFYSNKIYKGKVSCILGKRFHIFSYIVCECSMCLFGG